MGETYYPVTHANTQDTQTCTHILRDTLCLAVVLQSLLENNTWMKPSQKGTVPAARYCATAECYKDARHRLYIGANTHTHMHTEHTAHGTHVTYQRIHTTYSPPILGSVDVWRLRWHPSGRRACPGYAYAHIHTQLHTYIHTYTTYTYAGKPTHTYTMIQTCQHTV